MSLICVYTQAKHLLNMYLSQRFSQRIIHVLQYNLTNISGKY